jgi:hypothetical protein
MILEHRGKMEEEMSVRASLGRAAGGGDFCGVSDTGFASSCNILTSMLIPSPKSRRTW